MADKTWFTSLADDVNLASDAIAKDSDWYIQEYVYLGTGDAVYDLAGGTFTPATSPAWTVDGLISTVGVNFQLIDDNGKVASTIVTDNDATSLTIVPANLLLEEDGTTAATLTDTASYKIRVLTPSTQYAYGPYFGYVEGGNISITDEYMKFMNGMPKRLKFKDLSTRTAVLTGGNVDVANEDVLATILGAETYGSQTGQVSMVLGSTPDSTKTFRVTLKTSDRAGNLMQIICRQVQFESTGEILGSAESGHKMINFQGDLISDGFYPTDADLVQITRAT